MTLAFQPHRLGTGFGPTEVWNAVVAAAGAPVPLVVGQSVLVYRPAEPPPADAAVLRLRLPPLGDPSFVQLLDFPFRERFGVDLSVADLAGLPEALRAALVEGIVETARALLPASLASSLSLEGQGIAGAFPEIGSDALQAFEVELHRADGLTLRLRLVCDRASAVALAASHLPPPFGGRDERLAALAERITVPVDMTLGSLVMTLGELRAIEPGAIAVLPERPAGLVALRSEGRLFEFTDAGDGWRCDGSRRIDAPARRGRLSREPDGRMMDEAPFTPEADASAGGEGAEAFSLADLRLAVDFDLGRSLVPLSAVASWQPGALVELGAPALASGLPVTIRVNGDAVGSGDLVRIDDRIAVRITRLSLRA